MDLKGNCFKVYFSKSFRVQERLRLVAQAVIEVANKLDAEIEFKMMERTLSIVVYYSTRSFGTFLVYYDWGKNWGIDEIYLSIMSVINALSINNQMYTPA